MTRNTDHVDVTESFFKAVSSMEPGKVILTPDFDMLEGARALEIGNSRLDTGLIDLSDEALSFDSSKGQSLARVTAVMDQILVLCMTWMKGSPLSVTVLSCRYMLDILTNYKEKKLVKHASFINHRLHSEDYELSDASESKYVNVVLRAYVLGLAKFIGFGIRTGTEVLYEEEDMVTQTLGLDFLTQTSPQVVAAEIEAAERWLSTSPDAKSDSKFIQVMYYLRLAKQLTCFDDMMSLGVNLFHPQKFEGVAFLKQAIAMADLLSKNEQTETVPFAFSTFVQLDQSNSNNPSKNVIMDRSQAYKNLTQFLGTVDTIVTRLVKLENYSQFHQFLAYYVCHNLAVNDCALARGIFQLFLIRDDKSIAGSNEDVSSIALKAMEHFSLCGNSIMDPSSWNISNSSDAAATRVECSNRLMELFDDIETATYHELSLCGNNRCRQRQLRNRNIVILDTLQHKAETLEIDLFHHGIGDNLPLNSVDSPALGISSFVYYKKIETMIDVALSGFELDLYQTHEASMMFWYVSQLAAHSNVHLSTRIADINQSKCSHINSLQRQMETLKPGKKLEEVRQKYQQLKTTCLPILESNLNYVVKFAVLEKAALHFICGGIAMVIMLLQKQASDAKSSSLVDPEKLYNLRMKPWGSVGSPPVPEYEQYYESHGYLETAKDEDVQTHCESARNTLQEGISCVQQLLKNLESDPKLRTRLCNGTNSDIEDWYRKLQATAEAYERQIDLVSKKTGRLKRFELHLSYFPMFSPKEAEPSLLKAQ